MDATADLDMRCPPCGPPTPAGDALEAFFQKKAYNPNLPHQYGDIRVTRADSGVFWAYSSQTPANLVAIGGQR